MLNNDTVDSNKFNFKHIVNFSKLSVRGKGVVRPPGDLILLLNFVFPKKIRTDVVLKSETNFSGGESHVFLLLLRNAVYSTVTRTISLWVGRLFALALRFRHGCCENFCIATEKIASPSNCQTFLQVHLDCKIGQFGGEVWRQFGVVKLLHQ